MAISLLGEGQVGTGQPCAMQPLARADSLLQPSLELLPPYILSEAQIRSQRYCLFCWGREHRRGPSGCRFLPCGSPGPQPSRRSRSTCWGTAKTRPGLARAELADQRRGQETPGSRKAGKAEQAACDCPFV